MLFFSYSFMCYNRQANKKIIIKKGKIENNWSKTKIKNKKKCW